MARQNRYVSYLGTEIEPQALTTLTKFERATEKAFERIEAFNNKGSSRLGIGSIQGLDAKTKTAITGTTTALAAARSEATRVAPALNRVAAESSRVAVGFTRAGQSLSVVQGQLGPLAGRLGSLGTIFRDLAGISLAGVLGGAGAFALGNVATSYQKVTDRLRPFYETQQQTNAAMNDVIKIARDTRQALDPVAQLYSRLTQAGKDAGLAFDVSRVSTTVAKAARLSGGDADTQNNGITQFLQGVGSGTLGGDELKSIRENTFRLAKAIADGLGVPIAKLKELGAAGKLTPKIVTEALARSADQIDLEFSRLPKRIGASLTEAGNALGVFIGRIDETTHSTEGIAEAISALGNNLPNVVTGVSGLAAVFAVRNLAAPIDKAAGSLTRYAAAQAAILRGNASAITPRIQTAGKNLVAAQAARDEQLAVATSARAQVAAQQEVINKLREKQAAILGTAVVEKEATATATAAATGEVTAIEAQIAARRQDAAQIAANIALIEKQRAESALAAAQAATNAKLGFGRLGISRDTPASTRGSQDYKAALAYRRELAAINAEITASELTLAGAMDRSAVAAAASSRSIANSYAQRGISALASAEARIAAEVEVTAAMAAASAAQAASIPLIGAVATAQRALAAASTFAARSQAVLTKGASALSAMLGGPVGIALTAVTIGIAYLATRTDEAKDAAARFTAGQDELASKLGTSSEAFAKAAKAAAGYRLEIALAGLEDAKAKKSRAGSSLADSLETAAVRINPLYAQGRADITRLRELAAAARAGQISKAGNLTDIQALRDRNKDAFASSSVAGFLGSNPADVGIKAVGYKQTSLEIGEAASAVEAARKSISAPIKAPPLIATGTGKTSAQLDAEAKQLSSGAGALKKARADYAKTKADLKAELKSGAITQDDYVGKLAEAETTLNGAISAEKARAKAVSDGRKATTAAAKALRELNAEQERANARAEKLATITSAYDEAPRAIDKGAKDKRTIDGFFEQVVGGQTITLDKVKVGDQIFTKEDAEKVKDQIDAGVRRPITDAIKEQNQELALSKLILAGRSDEADLLRQKYALVKSVGDITDDELGSLKSNAAEQRRINDAIEKRNAMIDIQVQAYGNVRNAIRDVITGGTDIKNLKSIGARLKEQFAASVADKFVLETFGDPEKEARDALTRGLNNSADNLTTSATNLVTAATAMENAAASVDAAAKRQADPAAASSNPAVAAAAAAVLPTLSVNMDDIFKDAGVTIGGALQEATDEIVVVANRKTKDKDPLKMSIEDRYNDAGTKFATKIFGSGSILTKGFSKLGTFLSGAQYGGVGNAAVTGLGGKGSSLGAAIGGGLGKSLLGGKDGLLSKGLTAISSKLGSFAGPLGSIAGSVIGSVVGGLFKTNKQASSNVSVSAAGVTSTTGVGKGGQERAAATGLGSSASSGIQKIAEALGGSFGSSNVSIGYRPGHKAGAFRVDSSGQGKLTGVNAFETQEEAIEYAIVESLKQGAIKGIREGTKRLLAAGQDLDTALNNALRFEQVFKDLKAYTDPVGAAIDSLNTEFNSLINLFNQAGASASEFADLQKLYDLKRADAIKEATNASVDALDDFIKGLTASTDSPLNKRTAYENAKKNVDGFQADLAAGKTVDSDKLIDALSKLQDTSRALNGSGASFFADFDTILQLAEKAKSNITSTVPGQNGGVNTPSPFDTKPITDATGATTAAVQDSTQVIAGLLGDILSKMGDGGVNLTSAIAALPGMKAA